MHPSVIIIIIRNRRKAVGILIFSVLVYDLCPYHPNCRVKVGLFGRASLYSLIFITKERKMTPPSNAANMERAAMRSNATAPWHWVITDILGRWRASSWDTISLDNVTGSHSILLLDVRCFSDRSNLQIIRLCSNTVKFQIPKGRNQRHECRREFIN